jgi:dTDP-4-dehydrorhamnose reductase
MNADSLSSEDREVIALLDGSKIIITGAGGMLGNAFVNQIRKRLPSAKLLAYTRNQLDVCNVFDIDKIEAERPDIIIHCACLVNADLCELQPEIAKEVIVDGTKNIYRVAKKSKSVVLYPQSFLVFNGNDYEVDEDTVASPLNAYGVYKLEAELELLRQLPNSISLRLAGFFGGNDKDKNFVGKFLAMLQIAKKSKNHFEIGNRVWQPTYTEDIAANALLLLAKQKTGIYCMASHGSASFFEVAKEIVGALGLEKQISVSETDASIFAEREAAARPRSVIMRNRRLEREGLDRQRLWSSALKDYLSTLNFKL